MASHLATLGNPREMLLVLVMALCISGVSAINMGVPDILGAAVHAPIAPLQNTASDPARQGAEAPANVSAPVRALETGSALVQAEPAPVERFMGEGVGRKSPLATSRDDKRAFLLEATAIVRNPGHAGACELTERPLGGTTRQCTTATGRMLEAVSLDVGD